MKTKICICHNIILVLLYFSLINSYAIKGGGTGGGGGDCSGGRKDITLKAAPYSEEVSIDRKLIIQKKKDSNKKRIIKADDFPEYKDVLDRCHSIGVAYENGDRIRFHFSEYVREDDKYERIYFSDIDSIEIQKFYPKYRHSMALIKVVVFPTISVDELLERKEARNLPKYSKFREEYSKEVLFKINIRSYEYGYLQLVCNEDDYSRYTPIEKFANFPEGQKINFSYEIRSKAPIWWALDEVIDDRDYPFTEFDCRYPLSK